VTRLLDWDLLTDLAIDAWERAALADTGAVAFAVSTASARPVVADLLAAPALELEQEVSLAVDLLAFEDAVAFDVEGSAMTVREVRR
jgi:hypothetical protein